MRRGIRLAAPASPARPATEGHGHGRGMSRAVAELRYRETLATYCPGIRWGKGARFRYKLGLKSEWWRSSIPGKRTA
ncbi:hypothetical protein [Carbonactinospora thermoautotrophica]|uniref:hypothetical protein n=1 Tax=Carbonactinospora thermoautotrophica TaxID=1469144 RepID=UPI000A497907|nr:hypothetical protein [Carbonactinospora thermoautotrophica]